MERIEVAVGVLFNRQGQVLIGQRIVEDNYYQKWEFPGGKLEVGESAEQALIREFAEEVGIAISSSESFMVIEHDYPDRHVKLHVQLIHQYQGEITSMEGQALEWVELEKLRDIDFLKGNQVIVDELIKREMK